MSRVNVDVFVLENIVSKEFLDHHLRYVRTTRVGLLQYNTVDGKRYFFDKADVNYKIPMYEMSFIIKKGGVL